MYVVKKYFGRLVVLELLQQSFEQIFVYTERVWLWKVLEYLVCKRVSFHLIA